MNPLLLPPLLLSMHAKMKAVRTTPWDVLHFEAPMQLFMLILGRFVHCRLCRHLIGGTSVLQSQKLISASDTSLWIATLDMHELLPLCTDEIVRLHHTRAASHSLLIGRSSVMQFCNLIGAMNTSLWTSALDMLKVAQLALMRS